MKAQKYALISVYDKNGIVDFAHKLRKLGYRLISSGGTFRTLYKQNVPVEPVEDIRKRSLLIRMIRDAHKGDCHSVMTASCIDDMQIKKDAKVASLAEMLGHRVATLHAEIHGGLLATEGMIAELETLAIPWIDFLCVDFYPLIEEISRPDSTHQSIIEKMDIGGPTMVHSAIKGGRIVVCCPEDREPVLDVLKNGGGSDVKWRQQLAAKALSTTVEYYSAMAHYLANPRA